MVRLVLFNNNFNKECYIVESCPFLMISLEKREEIIVRISSILLMAMIIIRWERCIQY